MEKKDLLSGDVQLNMLNHGGDARCFMMGRAMPDDLYKLREDGFITVPGIGSVLMVKAEDGSPATQEEIDLAFGVVRKPDNSQKLGRAGVPDPAFRPTLQTIYPKPGETLTPGKDQGFGTFLRDLEYGGNKDNAWDPEKVKNTKASGVVFNNFDYGYHFQYLLGSSSFVGYFGAMFFKVIRKEGCNIQLTVGTTRKGVDEAERITASFPYHAVDAFYEAFLREFMQYNG